jgi:Mg-chelatase subunit ChlD
MQTISIVDALDAVEQNMKAFLKLAGERVRSLTAGIDPYSGTASIHHTRTAGALDVQVRFPALPAQARLTRAELDRWVGYFLHEMCHALYTDNAAWQDAVREGLHALVNGMEDVRIERKFNRAAIASNSKTLLNALLAYVVSQTPASYSPNDMGNLAWTLALFGRVELAGYALDVDALRRKMSPAVAALVGEALSRLKRAKSTGDVLEIARWIQRTLATAKGNGKGSGDKGSTGDAGKGSGEASGERSSDKATDAKPETSNASTGSGDGEEGDGEAEGNGDAGKRSTGDAEGDSNASTVATGGEGDGEESDADGSGDGAGSGDGFDAFDATKIKPVNLDPVSDAVKREVAKNVPGSRDAFADGQMVDAIRGAQRVAGKPLRAVPSDATQEATGLVKARAMQCSTMRQHVARVLKAEESETWQRGRAAGRLDRFALPRVAAGVTEGVYAKRTISGGYETEIVVLVDCSGSMSACMTDAATLALVVSQAASQVGVKCEVIAFATGKFDVVKMADASTAKADVLRTFGRLAAYAGGSTPLTGSIVKATARLAARAPHKRKLLFVVSDGACDGGELSVRKACEYAERVDVETVALCIDVNVHSGFKHGVRCNSSEIAKAGLGKLVAVLSRD